MSNKKKRDSVRWRGLDPQSNPKNRREVVDYDYLDNLTPEETDFINQFTEEWYNGVLPSRQTFDGLPSKEKDKFMHKTEEERAECWANNNKRNRDLFSGALATRRLVSLSSFNDNGENIKNEHSLNPEEMFIRSEKESFINKQEEIVRSLMNEVRDRKKREQKKKRKRQKRQQGG